MRGVSKYPQKFEAKTTKQPVGVLVTFINSTPLLFLLIFSQASVSHSVQWEGGHVWQGVCMAGGHVWQEGYAWQGACMMGGMCGRGCAWQGAMHNRGVCMTGGGGHAWQGGVHCMHAPYYEIRSMSGQYASYWNAFLFGNIFPCKVRFHFSCGIPCGSNFS